MHIFDKNLSFTSIDISKSNTIIVLGRKLRRLVKMDLRHFISSLTFNAA